MTVRLQGIPAAPGVAIGRAVIRRQEKPRSAERRAATSEEEEKRFADALEKARQQLHGIAETVARRAGEKEARIFRAHLLLLDDPLLAGAIKAGIRKEGLSAEEAIERCVRQLSGRFEALQDAYLRERAADIRDIGERLRANLAEGAVAGAAAPSGGILIAGILTPSETALLDRESFAGLVTEAGGSTGHAAILARALNFVAVAGVKGALAEIREGDTLVVDGTSGEVLVNPDRGTLEACRLRAEKEHKRRVELAALREAPAVTTDGFRVELLANIAAPGELEEALAAGAEGVGVFRTEYLFVNRPAPPSEEEQFEAYRAVARGMSPRPVIIRTMDLGGDKQASCWPLPVEPNPALGLRGIRLSLLREQDFRCQLRALLRAAAFGRLGILLPMVSGLSEVRRTRELIDGIAAELAAGQGAPQVSLGIMIETPAAAILAGDFAGQVDFFSIGTNDLTQYVLAADRMSEAAGGLYEPYHPAVLRLIQQVVLAARQHNRRVAICGEMAADERAAPLFVGMGIDELSMGPCAIPRIKEAIRRLSQAEASRLVEDVLKLSSADEVKRVLA